VLQGLKETGGAKPVIAFSFHRIVQGFQTYAARIVKGNNKGWVYLKGLLHQRGNIGGTNSR
jgi:hypothetical protein